MPAAFPDLHPPPFNVIVRLTGQEKTCGQCPMSLRCVQRVRLFEWKWHRRWGDDSTLSERLERHYTVCAGCRSFIWYQNDVLYICTLLAEGVWRRDPWEGPAGQTSKARELGNVVRAVTDTTSGAFIDDDTCQRYPALTCEQLYRVHAKQFGFRFYEIRDGEMVTASSDVSALGRATTL